MLTGTMFGRVFIQYEEATYISKEDYESIHSQYQPKEGDIIVTKIGTLGHVNILTENDIPLAIHCNSALLRFCEEFKGLFAYQLLNSQEFQMRLKAAKGQSIQEFVSLSTMSSILILKPDEYIVEKYNDQYGGILKKMDNVRRENIELSALRDFLLPMMMNGQVGFR